MKLQIASDVHLEFWRDRGMEDHPDFPLVPAEGIDALLLAGDIIVLNESLMSWLREYLGTRHFPTYYVLGNHEHYGQDYNEARERANAFFAGSRIVVLDNGEAQIGKARLIGSTLWTDYETGGQTVPEIAMTYADLRLNDCRMIRTSGGPFTATIAAAEHQVARKFLEKQLAMPHDGPTIVMTHHAPSISYGQHPAFPIGPLSGAFASELAPLFPQVDLWIWGHTHASQDVQVGRTRLLSNQFGYPHETPPRGFERHKIVEI